MEVIQNNTLQFDVTPYLNSRGWSVNTQTNKATHSQGISGELEFTNYTIQEGNSYQYSITVEQLGSGGSLIVRIGNAESAPITSLGYHQGVLTPTQSGAVRLYSASDITVSGLDIRILDNENVILDNNTITWSEERNGWVTFKEFIPEHGFSMYTNLFTVKDGKLWIHSKDNTIPNNFYGTQYYTRVKFPVASVGVKTYHSIALHGNKVMGTTENGIQTQLGNVTDLIAYDFDSREGIHYANKLRDIILDEKLKGRYIVIELTDEETKEQKLQLFKVVVKSEISTPNE